MKGNYDFYRRQGDFLEVLRGCGDAEVKYRRHDGWTVLMWMSDDRSTRMPEGLAPPMPEGSILAWTIDAENYMCLELTVVYYDHLCRPGGQAATLAATVLNDERVQAIRVPVYASDGKTKIGERKLVTAVVKGTEQPPPKVDLVTWSA